MCICYFCFRYALAVRQVIILQKWYVPPAMNHLLKRGKLLKDYVPRGKTNVTIQKQIVHGRVSVSA